MKLSLTNQLVSLGLLVAVGCSDSKAPAANGRDDGGSRPNDAGSTGGATSSPSPSGGAGGASGATAATGGVSSGAGGVPFGAGSAPVGSGGNSSGGAAGSGGDQNAPDAGTDPRPSPGCTGAHPLTSATRSLAFGGVSRNYDVHVPSGDPTGPRPLVINLHGYIMSPAQQATLTNMNALADTEGFVVAYPQGLGLPANWNAGACCSAAAEGDRDDIGFLNAVIDDIGAQTCLDLSRVYSMGFSNGGMMTYRLACEDAGRFAAVASVSGSATVPLDTCHPAHPIPLLHVHGTADPLVAYNGGPGALPLSGRPTPVFPSTADEVAAFRTKNGCPATSTPSFDEGNAHCDHWGPCDASSEVVFCTIDQGGHAWPGATGAFAEASPFDASAQIWAFFKGHALH